MEEGPNPHSAVSLPDHRCDVIEARVRHRPDRLQRLVEFQMIRLRQTIDFRLDLIFSHQGGARLAVDRYALFGNPRGAECPTGLISSRGAISLARVIVSLQRA